MVKPGEKDVKTPANNWDILDVDVYMCDIYIYINDIDRYIYMIYIY